MANPEIARAYALYRECSSRQLFTIDVVKGSGKSQKVHKKIVPFPVGITSLPEEGGMLDQPHRLMEYFDEFLSGERKAIYKELSS